MHAGVAVEKIKNATVSLMRIKRLQQEGHIIPSHDMIKTPEQIEKIKESGKINIAVLDYVAEHIKAGITTQQIDDWVYEQTTSRGANPCSIKL